MEYKEPVLDSIYQHVGFHFSVAFHTSTSGSGIDARFQSVSGLEVRLETESLKEGGENRFDHVLPTRKKTSELVLKRGVVSPKGSSILSKWCRETFDNLIIIPLDITVQLLNPDHQTVLKWDIIHAWPKSWKFGELNAERSEVLIETMELQYNRIAFLEA